MVSVPQFAFLTLAAVAFGLRRYFEKGPSEAGTSAGSDDPAFISFQRQYLFVYVLVVGSDWLQGPYVYELYSSYGYDVQAISHLFIVGFASSMVFGTIAGAVADKFGRKKLALAFGVIYGASCLTKLTPNYEILMLGRVLGGIATSLLFSVFESWMVYEHNARGFSPDWIGSTFDKSVLANGITAIVAGLVASPAVATFGPVAPFVISLVVLVFATGVILSTWSENYGDARLDVGVLFMSGVRAVTSDRRVLLLGVVQSLFEGAMYSFVFMWTPMLKDLKAVDPSEYGVIFSCFMVCIMIGSTLFSQAVPSLGPEKVGRLNFVLAAAALALPAVVLSIPAVFVGFFLFEMCCGVYFPCQGILRSRYISEEYRTGVMNLFRVPLNAIVVLLLTRAKDLGSQNVFALCALALLCATFAQGMLIASDAGKSREDAKYELVDVEAQQNTTSSSLQD